MNESEIIKIFSKRVKKLRKKHNITQRELAKKLDITSSAVGTYEQEKQLPRVSKVSELATLFNVSVDYLLGHTDIPESVNSIIKAISKNNKLYMLWQRIITKDKYKELLLTLAEIDEKHIPQITEIIKTFRTNDKHQP